MMKLQWTGRTFLVAVCIGCAGAAVIAGEGTKQTATGPVSLRVAPEQVTLWGNQASQHFTVLGKYADGLERGRNLNSAIFPFTGQEKVKSTAQESSSRADPATWC